MNKLHYILLLSIISSVGVAQPYGNEWIDYNQQYFKMNVGKEGIYRLTFNELNNVGFPVNQNNKQIQLFHRGNELAIDMKDVNGNNIFDSSDYLEFYAQANDGTLDAELYKPSTSQPHKYYNLYSDTTAYYITNTLTANGKRMVSSSDFVGGANDTYHFNKNLNVYTSNYSQGLTQVSYNSQTFFDIGEGFTGGRITENSNPVKDFVITGINQTVLSAPNPQLKLLLVGRNEQNHDVTVEAGSSLGSLVTVGTYSFSLFDNLLIDEAIDWTSISGSGELTVRVTVNSNGGDQSNISVSYILVEFGQDFDMNNALAKKFNLRKKNSGGNDVLITNTPSNATVYDITNPNNISLVNDSDVNTNTVKCGFNDATIDRVLYLNDPTNFITPSIIPASFRNMNTAANYIVISHSSLMKSAGGYADAVRAYAGYRSTPTGGSFDTLVVDIQQLYEQFSYGEITPLAIYRFMKYMVDKGDPKNLFLIGKALTVSTNFYRRPISDFTYYDLVPTAGQPGSDSPFTAGLDGTTYESAVPTGRLGASKPIDIINYLNKVIEHEATPYNDLWRKDMLNLSGGNNESELASFRGYVDGYASIAKGLYLGGETTTQSKTTSAPVEFINVSDVVNAGINQITFFGHSAPNVTDIDIGYVSDPANGYNNKGKYPIILMNGCNAGNIYNDDYIFGEDWVLTPNLGATAVIAHTSFGFSTLLNVWSNIFYTTGYGDINYMDKSIGEIMKETGRQMAAMSTSSFYTTQIQQMGLHGDPAIKLFGTQLPDYEISTSNVQPIEITNKGITAEADSFALALGVRNFAAYLNDSLEVFVRRTLQNGQVIDYDTITFNPVSNLDTLVYIIDNNYDNNFGTNSFEIVLDPASKLAELDEFNNRVFFNYFIPISGAINLSPSKFSIVTSEPIDLVSQISRLPSDIRTIEFELDSIRSFNNPSLFLKKGSAEGTLITEWKNIPIPTQDSTAYYWRSKYRDLLPGESPTWSESSFTYIKDGDEGWAQVHNPQFLDNTLAGLVFDDATKELKFTENKLAIDATTSGGNNPNQLIDLQIDGQAFILGASFQSCTNNRLAIVAFNHKKATPYAPIFGGQVDTWTCGRSPQIINIVADSNEPLLNDILDAIKPNDFVLIFTIGTFDFSKITSTTIDRLVSLGATKAIINGLLVGEPYILYGQNKTVLNPAIIKEILTDPTSTVPKNEQIITTPDFTEVVGSLGEGVMQSPLIGPAISWDRLLFSATSKSSNDKIGVDIIGKNFEGKETILSTGIQIKETVLNWIDPVQYPLLYLKYHVVDTVDKTPVQLNNWIINYTGAPEGVLGFIGNDKSDNLQIELMEGDSVLSEFGFINISDKLFTSQLKVDYTIFNATQRVTITNSLMIEPPALGDTTKFKIPVTTKGLVGENNLTVFVNNFGAPEQLYVNNNISIANYITVVKDETNPLLDISFDGRYIYDGEIVSANPTVLIKILDKNPLLQKTDTTGIGIFITAPCEGCSKKRISLSGNEIDYEIATKDKPFTINFKPEKLENGVYELSVQVEDASGNAAGIEPYIIHFEVVNEATVTNFYPYPNPFSSSVRFVFTLTGTEIPDGIMIRILTVTGRVVRTITQDEIGPVHIGNNQTAYAWDGRDEFGDQLANGVYLYKVTLEINGEKVDLRTSAGDKGFKNGYGKMYLLR